MNRNLKKALTLGCAMLMVSGALSVSAANLTKKVEAVYNNIKVTYDGKAQAPQYEPFMINGTVYVSLRDAGQITNNNVNWDSTNKTVQITSKTPQGSVSEAELANKNLEIATLKNQVAKLESKIAQYEKEEEEKKEEEASKPALDTKGLSKMEDLLIDEYGDDYKVEWDFNLDYDSKKDILELTVTYDSRYDKSDFNKISSNGNLKSFLEDVCEEIRDNYADIEITGEVYDSEERETKGTFSYSTKNRFSYSAYLTSDDLYDLSEEIADDWSNFPDLDADEFKNADIYIQVVELKAEDDNQTIVAEIYTDLVEADKEAWNSFKDSASLKDRRAITDYCREIVSFIKDETNASTVDLVFYTDHEKLIAKFQDNRLSLERMGR